MSEGIHRFYGVYDRKAIVMKECLPRLYGSKVPRWRIEELIAKAIPRTFSPPVRIVVVVVFFGVEGL